MPRRTKELINTSDWLLKYAVNALLYLPCRLSEPPLRQYIFETEFLYLTQVKFLSGKLSTDFRQISLFPWLYLTADMVSLRPLKAKYFLCQKVIYGLSLNFLFQSLCVLTTPFLDYNLSERRDSALPCLLSSEALSKVYCTNHNQYSFCKVFYRIYVSKS